MGTLTWEECGGGDTYLGGVWGWGYLLVDGETHVLTHAIGLDFLQLPDARHIRQSRLDLRQVGHLVCYWWGLNKVERTHTLTHLDFSHINILTRTHIP